VPGTYRPEKYTLFIAKPAHKFLMITQADKSQQLLSNVLEASVL